MYFKKYDSFKVRKIKPHEKKYQKNVFEYGGNFRSFISFIWILWIHQLHVLTNGLNEITKQNYSISQLSAFA